MTMCGYGTVTTRERLNGLARMLGIDGFHQHKHRQYHGDTEIYDDDEIVVPWAEINAKIFYREAVS